MKGILESFETDYLFRFELNSRYGLEQLSEEYNNVIEEAKKDYKKLTELVIALGVACMRRQKDDESVRQKDVIMRLFELHNDTRRWGIVNLTGDEFAWFYKYTRGGKIV